MDRPFRCGVPRVSSCCVPRRADTLRGFSSIAPRTPLSPSVVLDCVLICLTYHVHMLCSMIHLLPPLLPAPSSSSSSLSPLFCPDAARVLRAVQPKALSADWARFRVGKSQVQALEIMEGRTVYRIHILLCVKSGDVIVRS